MDGESPSARAMYKDHSRTQDLEAEVEKKA